MSPRAWLPAAVLSLSALAALPSNAQAPRAWTGQLQPGAWSGKGCPQLPPKPMQIELALTQESDGAVLHIGYPSGDVRPLPLRGQRIETTEGDALTWDLTDGIARLHGRLVIAPLPDCLGDGWTLVDPRQVDARALLQTLRVRAALLERIDNEVERAREAGKVSASLDAARAIVKDAEQGLPPGDPVITRALLRLAQELSWAGRFEDTIAITERALADPRRSLPDGDYKVISGLEYLAHALGEVRGIDAQRTAQERVVQLARENFGPNHEETMAQVTTLAMFLGGSGQQFVPQAVQMQEANYAAQRALLGPTHGDVLRSASALQNLLLFNGEVTRSRTLAQSKYDDTRAAYGERHPRTIRALNDYGGALLAAGATEDALVVLREADRLMDEVVQGATNDVLGRKQRLHTALLVAGRYAEALRFGENLARLTAQAQLPRLNHATLLRNAGLQSDLGMCDQAVPVLEQLIVDIAAFQGINDIQVLEAREIRARCLRAQGNQMAALAEIDAVAQAYVSFQSPSNPRLPLLALERARWLAASDPAGARTTLAAALERARPVLGPDHPTLLALELQAAQLDTAAAEGAADALLERARRILGPRHPTTLRFQAWVAGQLMQQQRWAGAEALLDDYVARVEGERSSLEAGRSERQSLLSEHVLPYKRGVYVKLALGRTAGAFQLSEMAKARGLLDALTMRRASDYAGLSAEQSTSLRNAEARVRAIDDVLARDDRSPVARANLIAERGAALAELEALRQSLISTNRSYARLAGVRNLDAAEVARVLPQGTVLVSFVAADQELVAFTVRRGRAMRAYKLGALPSLVAAIDDVRSGIQSGSHPAAALAHLSSTLLTPLAADLRAARRWVIVPDGALARLPFELLPFPEQGRPSVDHATIIYAPSASIYALTLQSRGRTPSDRMLAVGDPDFASLALDRTDAGRDGSRHATTMTMLDTGRAVTRLPTHLDRLPGTRAEVLAVARVRGARHTDVLLGSSATEAQLRRLAAQGELEKYRYLLFATHGLLDADAPLSSAVVLGREGPDDPNDGIVTALKWTGLRLDSDLTVLSACDTGLGRDLPGEGIMGLPYALFVAGNRQTILTLWQVPDASTARFVARLFEHLARGTSSAEALAQTKREFARRPGSSARNWAGFVIYGS